MAKEYSDAESVESIAKRVIPDYSPHLATARMRYVFVDKASKKGGQEILGKVRRLGGAIEHLLEADFLIEVAQDKWNEMSQTQREALTDHLLERCHGEEDEKSGEMKWTVQEPDVQEFASILRRHGAWNDQLISFCTIAKEIELDQIIEDETEEEETDLDEVLAQVGEDDD